MKSRKVSWSSQNITVVGISAKYWDTETGFQVWCATYLRKHHPTIKFHHSANERLGGKSGLLCKLKGQSKGFPDLLIFGASLALELKMLDGKVSLEQLDWLAYFKSIGWHSEIVRSADRFIELVTSNLITGQACNP